MNQDKYDGLGSQGYTGAFNDRLRAMYIALGASGGALQDLEESFLLSKGVDPAALQDMWASYLAGNPPPWTNLELAAIAAIRRNNGTALYVPDDYGLVLGPELMTDPTFDDPSKWTPGAGWSVAGGNAVATAVASGTNMVAAAAGYSTTVSGKTYMAEVVVSSISGGVQLIIWNGSTNVANSSILTTPGTYRLTYTANNTQCRPYLSAQVASTTLTAASLSQREILSATTFIDSTGTQPVTAINDLVGLLTDRSYGSGNLGPNVFSDAAVVFGGESSRVSPGVYRIYSSAGVFSNITQTGAGMLPNKMYRLRFNVDSITSGVLAVDGPAGAVVAAVSAGTGQKECFVQMTATATISIKRSSGVTDVQISNVRIEEVLGNHATQPTTASKPTVTRVPKRLGPNLVVNGDGNDATGWTVSGGTLASVGGEFVLTANAAASFPNFSRTVTLVVGKTYRISAQARVGTSGNNVGFNVGGGFSPTFNTVVNTTTTMQQWSHVATATASVSTLQAVVSAASATAGTSVYDNIEVREVLEWTNAISFDGVNDFLALSSVPFQMTDDHCIIAGATTNDFAAVRSLFGAANASITNSRIQLYTAQTSGSLLGMWRDDASTINTVSFASAAIGVPYVATIRKVGSQLAGRKDGGAWTTGTATVGTTTLTRADVGAASPSNAPGGFHAGSITAVVLLRGNVPDADILLIEKWIASLQGQTL